MAELQPERFLEDVLDTPRALRVTADLHAAGGPLARLGQLDPRPRRILFMGMGSSRYAALTVAALLRSRGVDAHAEFASTGLPQPGAPDTLAIAISATGGSAETLAALRRHRGRSHVAAVTNRPRRPLGLEADLCLALSGGEEVSGVACKSYACTLAVLVLVAGRLLGEPALGRSLLRAAADASERLLESAERWLEQAADLLGERALHVVAPAERLGSAEQSALVLREVPRIRADACESGDWSHVDVYLSRRPGLGLLLLRGSGWEGDLVGWVTERGVPAITVDGTLPGLALDVPVRDGGDLVLRALVECQVAELLAGELWRRDPI
jgi:glutamine---fructose-6-phosphate transaminase (isomerizing)